MNFWVHGHWWQPQVGCSAAPVPLLEGSLVAASCPDRKVWHYGRSDTPIDTVAASPLITAGHPPLHLNGSALGSLELGAALAASHCMLHILACRKEVLTGWTGSWPAGRNRPRRQ